MKITVSQQDKKITISFIHKGVVDRFVINKADKFLECVDKFIRKRKIKLKALKNARLEFSGTGILTERIIKVIILGLSF